MTITHLSPTTMLHRTALTILALLLTLTPGCASAPRKPVAPPTLADRIAEYHGADAWRHNKAISGRMAIAFADQPLLELSFVHEISTGRTRMELADGTLLVWDGQHAWVSPAASKLPMARFHLLTWPYFIATPFKLHDPGVQFSEPIEGTLSKNRFLTSRMTFAPGTGDSPDDWYVLYADPKSARLEALAYTVSYGKTRAQADEDPHAITFYDFRRIDGVLLPLEWRFWKWNKSVGLYGQPMGRAVLRDVEFLAPKPGTFAKPADAREDLLPSKP